MLENRLILDVRSTGRVPPAGTCRGSTQYRHIPNCAIASTRCVKLPLAVPLRCTACRNALIPCLAGPPASRF